MYYLIIYLNYSITSNTYQHNIQTRPARALFQLIPPSTYLSPSSLNLYIPHSLCSIPRLPQRPPSFSSHGHRQRNKERKRTKKRNKETRVTSTGVQMLARYEEVSLSHTWPEDHRHARPAIQPPFRFYQDGEKGYKRRAG